MAVLSVLVAHERYGLQILDQANARGVIVAEGALYPLLGRWEAEGRIKGRWEVGEAAHPRKYYRLSDDGRAALEMMRRAWIEFREAMTHLVETPHAI